MPAECLQLESQLCQQMQILEESPAPNFCGGGGRPPAEVSNRFSCIQNRPSRFTTSDPNQCGQFGGDILGNPHIIFPTKPLVSV
jgi:hypothetical protein